MRHRGRTARPGPTSLPPPLPSPKELRKSAIFLMELVITSMYSRLAQSWWISRCTGSSCTDMAAAATAPRLRGAAPGTAPDPARRRRRRRPLPQGSATAASGAAAPSSSLLSVPLPLGSCRGRRRQRRGRPPARPRAARPPPRRPCLVTGPLEAASSVPRADAPPRGFLRSPPRPSPSLQSLESGFLLPELKAKDCGEHGRSSRSVLKRHSLPP